MLTNNWYKTLLKGVGRWWFKKTLVVKQPYKTCDSYTEKLVEHIACTRQLGMALALIQVPQCCFPGGRTIALVLTEGWPRRSATGWGLNTNILGFATSTMWHEGGWTDQKNGPCSGRTAPQRKQKEGTQKEKPKKKERKGKKRERKEGLQCKRLKRKKHKVQLAIPWAVS